MMLPNSKIERKFLTANWKFLLMFNYIVDPELLMPYVPYKTTLDYFNGNCYVSLVGFLFTNTRVNGIKIPWHINFEEVNLRFYIQANDEVGKRGVVFISEIVPRRAITFVANTVYGENYRYMRMQHSLKADERDIHASYRWKYRDNWNEITATADSNALEMAPGSEAEFIAEHYHGYSRINSFQTNAYEVTHPRWNCFAVKNHTVNCDFKSLYGPSFGFLQQALPSSVLLYEGSEITVGRKRVIK